MFNVLNSDYIRSYHNIILWPNLPVEDAACGEVDKSRRWSLVLSPRHTWVCLWVNTRLCLDLKPKSNISDL